MADRVPTSQGQPSELYMACRNGEYEKAKTLLTGMTVDQINKVEKSNNSTALHAAAYYGHTQIAQLLIAHGAATDIRNGFNLLPEEEATKSETKDIFYRLHRRK